MRVILSILLLLFASPLWAEWVVISKIANGTVFYIDPLSIQKDGHLRRVATLMNLKEKNKEGKQSARALEEYACQAEQNRVLSYSDHTEPFAMGEILSSSDTPTQWKSLAPGTIGQAILLLVCKLAVEKDTPVINLPTQKPPVDDWWQYEGRAGGGR
jgi:hypothetical protein